MSKLTHLETLTSSGDWIVEVICDEGTVKLSFLLKKINSGIMYMQNSIQRLFLLLQLFC